MKRKIYMNSSQNTATHTKGDNYISPKITHTKEETCFVHYLSYHLKWFSHYFINNSYKHMYYNYQNINYIKSITKYRIKIL